MEYSVGVRKPITLIHFNFDLEQFTSSFKKTFMTIEAYTSLLSASNVGHMTLCLCRLYIVCTYLCPIRPQTTLFPSAGYNSVAVTRPEIRGEGLSNE